MEVRAIKRHESAFGPNYVKEIGDIYIVPDEYLPLLVFFGFVEPTSPTPLNPARDMMAIVPSDTTVFDRPTRSIYIGRGGDLVIRTVQGQDIPFTFAQFGFFLPVQAIMVKATGTTAENLVAVF